MSFLLRNNAEGGTNGADISPTNTGGLSGEAWTNISLSAGNTAKFSNAVARNTLSYQIATGASAGEVSIRWLDVPAVPTIYARFYIFMTTLPSASFRPIELGGSNGFTTAWSLGIRTDGKVSIRDSAGTQMSVSGSALQAGRWMRIELSIAVSQTTGSSVVKLYREADSPYPTEVMASTAVYNTQPNGDPMDIIRFGVVGMSAPNYTYYLDDLAVTDMGFLGPANPNYTSDLLWRNGGGNGANGTLATPLSTGSSTDHFFQIVNDGSQVYHSTVQSAHGGSSYLVQSTSGVGNWLSWRDLTASSLACRYYAYFTAHPSTATEISQFLVTSPVYEMLARVGLSTAGKMIVMDRNGTILWTSTAAIPLNTWIRIEMFAQLGVTAGTGTVQVAYYTLDSTTATDSFSSNTVDLNVTPFARLYLGRINSSAWTDPFYLDDIAILQGATGFIGPYAAPSNLHTPYAGKIPHLGWGVHV